MHEKIFKSFWMDDSVASGNYLIAIVPEEAEVSSVYLGRFTTAVYPAAAQFSLCKGAQGQAIGNAGTENVRHSAHTDTGLCWNCIYTKLSVSWPQVPIYFSLPSFRSSYMCINCLPYLIYLILYS